MAYETRCATRAPGVVRTSGGIFSHMPKVGMEPVRREQILKAAVKVIAKKGFIRTTLADVAGAAKVSTGMINHYYKNKTHLLVETLIYVSERVQEKVRARFASAPAGVTKLRILIEDSLLLEKGIQRQAAQVWAWAIAEAIHSKEMAATLDGRRHHYELLIEEAILALVPSRQLPETALRPLITELNSYFTGLALHSVARADSIDPATVERSLLAAIHAALADQPREVA